MIYLCLNFNNDISWHSDANSLKNNNVLRPNKDTYYHKIKTKKIIPSIARCKQYCN